MFVKDAGNVGCFMFLVFPCDIFWSSTQVISCDCAVTRCPSGIADRYVVCMGGIEAFAFPSQGKRSEVPAAQLRDGATVVAVAQEQDWLKV